MSERLSEDPMDKWSLVIRLRNHSGRPAACDCARCEAANELLLLERLLVNERTLADDMAVLIEEASWQGEPAYVAYAIDRGLPHGEDA